MKAAIYCRVSTDNQEREGTSLQTQLEACLKYCQDKGYDVFYRFSEAYSGLSLERPELDKLRELVRNDVIDILVVYCLDRLSRDPTHGVILTQELEKHNITLEAVIEDVDNSELGKLISYIRGFASKLEAEKIRERSMRGKKAKAGLGYLPAGGYSRLYGYDFIKNQGRRAVNETEAKWAVKMFEWLVNEGMSTTSIAKRLTVLGVPSKTGNAIWSRKSVWRILANPAYAGRTYYTGIEMPTATPPIIDSALFEAAKRQLHLNTEKSKRNIKHEYLLHGYVFCSQCGRRYWSHHNGQRKDHVCRRYVCSGRVDGKAHRCANKGWNADKLESMVWAELERYLSNRDLILSEVEKHRQNAGKVNVFDTELEQVERHLRAADREQRQLLQWALKGFPDDQVEAENKRLNKARETLKAQKADLEAQLKASQAAVINVPKLEGFIEDIQERLPNLDYEGKRLAFDMLGIKVWIDADHVNITGTIDPELVTIAPTLCP